MSERRLKRRQLLRQMGQFGCASSPLFSPAWALLQQMALGMGAAQIANAQGLKAKRYFFLQNFAGPARWMWDLMLNLNGEDLGNRMMATSFAAQGGRLTIPQYTTTSVFSPQLQRTIQVPYLWQASVPRPGGLSRPMTDLLQNFLVLRGIDVNSPDHTGAAEKMTFIPGSQASLSGAVADLANTPIGAVEYNVYNLKYKSQNNSSLSTLQPGGSESNVFKVMLDPFQTVGGGVQRQLATSLDNQIEAVIDSLMTSKSLYSPQLKNDRLNAKELIKTGFGDLSAEWTALYSKYRDLIQRSFAVTVPGLNDLPLGVSGDRSSLDYRWIENVHLTNADIRTLINPGTDATSTTVYWLAEGFALAEFCLTRGYSHSVHIGNSYIYNVFPQTGLANYSFDSHSQGVFPTTLLNSMYFLAQSACLLELIERLKEKNLFNETVIHTAGEFNRRPQIGASGADHAWEAQSVSLMSGAIQGPMVVGNIYKNSAKPELTSYPGTWGYAAPVLANKTIVATEGNVIATVANLLRIPNPSPNNQPLAYLTTVAGAEKVVPLVGPPEIIDNSGST